MEMKTLGTVATYINGRAFKPSEWEKAGMPIIRIQNLTSENAPYNYSKGIFEEKYIVHNGDLLFACVNLARLLKVDEEEALNKASKKFARRFKYVEDKVLQNNKSMKDVSIDELNKFWDEAKINE